MPPLPRLNPTALNSPWVPGAGAPCTHGYSKGRRSAPAGEGCNAMLVEQSGVRCFLRRWGKNLHNTWRRTAEDHGEPNVMKPAKKLDW